jgi:hypothetical protein
MHNGGRNDDTSTKLAHGDNESAVHTDRCEPGRENRCEYTYGTGNEDDEEKTNPQRYVVVVIGCSASHVNRSPLSINAMSG